MIAIFQSIGRVVSDAVDDGIDFNRTESIQISSYRYVLAYLLREKIQTKSCALVLTYSPGYIMLIFMQLETLQT